MGYNLPNIWINVDLPLPDSPTIAIFSLSFIFKLKFYSIFWFLYGYENYTLQNYIVPFILLSFKFLFYTHLAI